MNANTTTLGISNAPLAENLAIKNGNTKISPSTASIACSPAEPNCWEQISQGEDDMPVKIRRRLRWTGDSTKRFLRNEFKLAPESCIYCVVESHLNPGLADELPPLPDSSSID